MECGGVRWSDSRSKVTNREMSKEKVKEKKKTDTIEAR